MKYPERQYLWKVYVSGKGLDPKLASIHADLKTLEGYVGSVVEKFDEILIVRVSKK